MGKKLEIQIEVLDDKTFHIRSGTSRFSHNRKSAETVDSLLTKVSQMIREELAESGGF